MRIFWILALTLLFGLSCDDDKMEDERPTTLVIENVHLTDEIGAPIGCYPECDMDWTHIPLGDVEALNFENNESISTSAMDSIGLISAYPNPFNSQQALFVNSPHEYKMNIAIVDMENNTLFQYAGLADGSTNLIFNYEDIGLVNEQLYRMYYRFTNADQVIVYEGYGDIYGCDIPLNYIDCYPE